MHVTISSNSLYRRAAINARTAEHCLLRWTQLHIGAAPRTLASHPGSKYTACTYPTCACTVQAQQPVTGWYLTTL